jgi:hypothetical protein
VKVLENTARPDPARWATLSTKLDVLVARGLLLPGPATTLEVLGRSEVEIYHERLIAWLLNPAAPHYLGTAVLHALLRRFLASDTPPVDQLIRARVRTQAVGTSSRPDIVVTLPTHTLLIELKINSPEGWRQTTRQADDHAHMPHPILVFLTRSRRPPADDRFEALGLADFAADLRQSLGSAPKPCSPTTISGRAVAHDYLATLEKMLGMDLADQEGARFWLTHGQSLLQAQESAKALLAQLPAYVTASLQSLSAKIGEGLVASSFRYQVSGRTGREFTEDAVLLAREQWLGPDGRARFGMGFGQRAKPNPDVKDASPFWGVYAADPVIRATLRDIWAVGDQEPWGEWVWWEYLDLEPPPDGRELLVHYAEKLANHVRTTWHRRIGPLDTAVGRPSS